MFKRFYFFIERHFYTGKEKKTTLLTVFELFLRMLLIYKSYIFNKFPDFFCTGI